MRFCRLVQTQTGRVQAHPHALKVCEAKGSSPATPLSVYRARMQMLVKLRSLTSLTAGTQVVSGFVIASDRQPGQHRTQLNEPG